MRCLAGLLTLILSFSGYFQENVAAGLWDAYSGLFGDQAMILAMNSRYGKP